MCLILLAHKPDSLKHLVVAANRDEFLNRPTEKMHFWNDNPNILAGKDLAAGGTWLGITISGRFAALTNYRDPLSQKIDAPSRGKIITDYLESDVTPAAFLEEFRKKASMFNGFNIIVADKNSLYWFSNRKGEIKRLGPGIYGISNHLLDTPWPKVSRGKNSLKAILSQEDPITTESLFSMLKEREIPEDDKLPDTGVGIEWERILGPIFIHSPSYGTRSSTVLIMENSGKTVVCERTFDGKSGGGKNIGYSEKRFSFQMLP